MDPLRGAIAGTGPAITPIPVATATVSTDYVQLLLEATRPDDATAPLESEDIAVVVSTSGSTGHPKGVLHTTASLTALTPAIVDADADPRWIAALPLTSMGGLNVLIRSLASGREPIGLPSLGGAAPFTPAAFAAAVAAAESADIRTSLVAAQVRRLLSDPSGVAALQACHQVLVGAGPTPQALLDEAAALGITLTVTYGATETAGGCVYDGHALAGVGVDLDDDGEILLAGPMLARGYRLDPEATAERFGARGYRTRDAGRIDAGRLTILGRLDDVVIVNGVNVSIGAVEQVLAEVAGIAQAVVVDISTGARGQLGALVVGDVAAEDARDVIATEVERRLGRAAVPTRIAIVTELAALPNGKIDRLRIRALAQEGQIAWLQ